VTSSVNHVDAVVFEPLLRLLGGNVVLVLVIRGHHFDLEGRPFPGTRKSSDRHLDRHHGAGAPEATEYGPDISVSTPIFTTPFRNLGPGPRRPASVPGRRSGIRIFDFAAFILSFSRKCDACEGCPAFASTS